MDFNINRVIDSLLTDDGRRQAFLNFIDKVNHPGDTPIDSERIRISQILVDQISYTVSRDEAITLCDILLDNAPPGSRLCKLLSAESQQVATLKNIIKGIYDRYRKASPDLAFPVDEASRYVLNKLYEAGFIAYPRNPESLKGVAKVFLGRTQRIGHILATDLSSIIKVPYEHIMADAMINGMIQNNNASPARGRSGYKKTKDKNITLLVNAIITNGSEMHNDPGFTVESYYVKAFNRYRAIPEHLKRSTIARMIDYGATQFPDAIAKLHHYWLTQAVDEEIDMGKPKRRRL